MTKKTKYNTEERNSSDGNITHSEKFEVKAKTQSKFYNFGRVFIYTISPLQLSPKTRQ